jgi:hypothetical protein
VPAFGSLGVTGFDPDRLGERRSLGSGENKLLTVDREEETVDPDLDSDLIKGPFTDLVIADDQGKRVLDDLDIGLDDIKWVGHQTDFPLEFRQTSPWLRNGQAIRGMTNG